MSRKAITNHEGDSDEEGDHESDSRSSGQATMDKNGAPPAKKTTPVDSSSCSSQREVPRFSQREDGDLTDSRGQRVVLMADVREIMRALHSDERFAGARVAVASCCDEPAWARECMSKFVVAPDVTLQQVVSLSEIHKGSKADHLRNISRDSGVALRDMVFFDNEKHNCNTVQGVGVTSVHTPRGVTMVLLRRASEQRVCAVHVVDAGTGVKATYLLVSPLPCRS